MLRRLCQFFAVGCALLLVVTLGVTVRSFFAADFVDVPLPVMPLHFETHVAQLEIHINDDWLPQTLGWRHGPADYTLMQNVYRHGFLGFAGQGSQGVGATRVHYYALHLVIPAWFAVPALAGGVWFHAAAARRFYQRQRIAHGLCAHCGYDLRAHAAGSTCPECGLVSESRS